MKTYKLTDDEIDIINTALSDYHFKMSKLKDTAVKESKKQLFVYADSQHRKVYQLLIKFGGINFN